MFLAERTFLPVNLRSNPVDNQGLSLYEIIKELREEGVLSEFSEAVLLELTNSLKSNYEKTISDADMKQVVVNLIERFDSHGFSKDSYEGEMLGTILAISIASLECWENNPELMPSDTKIAHWVAMDISGVAIGAVSGAVGGLITQGEVSAKGVAYGAVAGAVTGSTGIVGKGAKWIQGILK